MDASKFGDLHLMGFIVNTPTVANVKKIHCFVPPPTIMEELSTITRISVNVHLWL